LGLDELQARLARPKSARLVTPLFLLITASTFSYFVAVGALQPTLPRYVEGPLAGGSVAVGVAIGMFSFAAVLARPFIGRVGDRRGRRLLMVAGAGVVALSVFGYVAADNLPVLLALRFVSGIGEACFYVGAASVINDLAPDSRRGEALSYFSLALYAGLAIGPVLGESVLGGGRFDLAWIMAGAAAALAAVLAVPVPDTRPEEIADLNPDYKGRIIHPAGVLPGVVLATSVWGLGGFSTFIPLYALELGLDGSRMVFVTYSVLVIVIRLFGAQIPDRLGPSRSARSALTLQAAGLAVMGLWNEPVGLFAGTALFAVGHSLAFPALMTLAIGGAPVSERAAVVGTFTAFFDLAFGLGALTLGGVAAIFGYGGALVGGALVSLGGLALLVARGRQARALAPR
jgi:MFS family permease